MPRSLTELHLHGLAVERTLTPRSMLKAMFTRLPELRFLCAAFMEMAPLLQGMLDAGADALPHLRRVQCDNGSVEKLVEAHALLRRYLHKFPAVHVHFDYTLDLDDGRPDAKVIAHHYGRWPRVTVDPAPGNPPPSPHASDDEPESDVEPAADPHEAEEQH